MQGEPSRVRATSLCLAGLVWIAAAPASALPVRVAQDAAYRYVNATAATTQAVPANWFAFDFDDSGWFESQGPFSSSGAASFGADSPNVDDPFDGAAPPLPADAGDYARWDVGFDPLVRTEFTLTEAIALTLWIAVDNGIGPYPSVPGSTGMFLNGVEATDSVNQEGAAFRWEHVFDIPAEYTFAGRNVFAFNLEDHGGATGFAMVVTDDDLVDHPVFTTNPAPMVPEPSTGLLLGMGLGALAARRAARRPTS